MSNFQTMWALWNETFFTNCYPLPWVISMPLSVSMAIKLGAAVVTYLMTIPTKASKGWTMPSFSADVAVPLLGNISTLPASLRPNVTSDEVQTSAIFSEDWWTSYLVIIIFSHQHYFITVLSDYKPRSKNWLGTFICGLNSYIRERLTIVKVRCIFRYLRTEFIIFIPFTSDDIGYSMAERRGWSFTRRPRRLQKWW